MWLLFLDIQIRESCIIYFMVANETEIISPGQNGSVP